MATRGLEGVYQCRNDSDRRLWASLVAATTEEAVEQGVLATREGAIRIANLASFLSENGVDLFDPNQIVARCLDLIGIPFDVATKGAGVWRSLPPVEIAVLRDAKNLVVSCARLMDRVTDTSILADLRRWYELRERLP